jgi:hypothetical protein
LEKQERNGVCGFLRSRDDESAIPLPVQRVFFKLDSHLARSFAAVPHRVTFLSHMHRWLVGTPGGVIPWRGDQRLCLDGANRYLVVIHAVYDGKWALFDTEANDLIPFGGGAEMSIGRVKTQDSGELTEALVAIPLAGR